MKPPPDPDAERKAEGLRKALETRRANYALKNAQTQKWRAEAKADLKKIEKGHLLNNEATKPAPAVQVAPQQLPRMTSSYG